MDRYVGLDGHSQTCTLAVMSRTGKRLTSKVVETNGRALVDAMRSFPGDLHLCLEEGAQSAWFYEILSPHVAETVVTVPEQSRGSKDDLRDAWARADDLRTGRIRTRVYKAPKQLAGLRSAASAYRLATQDMVRTKNRLKAVFRFTRDPDGHEGLRCGWAEHVAEAASVRAPRACGVAWSRARRSRAVAGRSRRASRWGSRPPLS